MLIGLFMITTIYFMIMYFVAGDNLKQKIIENENLTRELVSIKNQLYELGDLKALETKLDSVKEDNKREIERKKEEFKEQSRILKLEIETEKTRIKNEEKRLGNISIENLALREIIEQLSNLWINDTFKAICSQIRYNNHSQLEVRMEKTFEKCRSFGITFDGRQEQGFFTRLKTVWHKECEEQQANEEQDRIKEIMKDEQRAEKMRATELKKIEAQEKSIIAKQKENEEKMKHLREIEGLKTLNDAQKSELEQMIKENEALAEELVEKERAKSMAELTKAGHIYVVSNIGSFGENIFKVGMTRRLIPEDRVDELGDASVPFPFDIHMMIATENAPSLEKVLHDSLDKNKLNCVNGRKEFFQTDLVTIKGLIDKHSPGTKYHFTEVPQATQWRESQIIRSKQLKANQNKEAA